MIYKCGCEASGDNVAPYCPIHGDVAEVTGTITLPRACGLWQAIATAPKDTDVLVCDADGVMYVVVLPSTGVAVKGRLDDGYHFISSIPVFWMPLPEGPEKASKYLDSIKSVYVHWSESNLINSELGNVPEDSGDILKEVEPVAFDNLVKRASALVRTGYDKTSLTVTFKDGKVYGANGGCKFYLTRSKDSLMKLIEDEG